MSYGKLCCLFFVFVLFLLLLLNVLNFMNNNCRLVELTTRLPVNNKAVCLHGLGQGQFFLLAYICSSDNANGKVRYFNTQVHLGQAFRNGNSSSSSPPPTPSSSSSSSSSSFEMAALLFLFCFFFFLCHLDLYLSKTYSGQREVNQMK